MDNSSHVAINTAPKESGIASEAEESYKKGKEIFYKYDSKKKMAEAAAFMEPMADTGDLDACHLVLQAYTIAEKYSKAEKYLKPLIENKKTESIMWYADAIKFVKGRACRSRDLFLLAAENGNADAYEELASFYYGQDSIAKDYSKIMEYYLKGADKGSAACMRHLADIYRAGLGNVKPDHANYLSYLKNAAEGGDSTAQWWMGCNYYKGKNGFKTDKQMANHWFEKAANNPKKPVQAAKLALNGDYSGVANY